jgi:2'-5' RNA ligase
LFIAKPQPDVLSAMVTAVTASGLDHLLGAALFAPDNWHQSLSDRYSDEPELRDRLLHAGGRISAVSVTMTLNRIISKSGKRGIQWAFRARGEPPEFQELLNTVQAALRAEGLSEEQGHIPHITISYAAPARLSSQKILPIEWTVNEILLVKGGGEEPYQYRTLGRWQLLAPPYPYAQMRLL